MRKTTVINIFGGPGSGKSTIAAGVFYELKKRSVSVELVREYVKKWAWEGVLPNRLDQLYISGKQTKAEHMLYGKVEFVVTDCPLQMGVFYDRKYNSLDTTEAAIDRFLKETSHVNRVQFITTRCKPYVAEGRYCSERAALETDGELLEFLQERGISPWRLEGDVDAQVQQVLRHLILG